FSQKKIHIHYDEGQTSLRAIVELLTNLGYAPAINLNNLEEKEKPKVDRNFYYKLGYAGFAFGNIMLLSFPEYLGLNLHQDQFFFKLFGYLNILLAIPVILFSGIDYLRSAWVGLRHKELNIDVPITIGVLALFGRSVYEILSHTGAGYLDSLSGLILFLLIGKWFQQKTYHQIAFDRDYRSYFPIAANLLKGGILKTITLDQLNVGDIIVVKNQELIPADAILKSGAAKIDYSFVTGESEPVQMPIGEKVFAGGRQVGTDIELTLVKKVSHSYLTQLWNDKIFDKEQETRASALALKVGKYFTIFILSVALATLLYWLPKDSAIAFNAFTAVLIIACPCAVALAIPFIFGNVLTVLAKQQFYLKNTNVIEALSGIGTVVMDKTGTLTTRKKNKIEFIGKGLNSLEAWMIKQACGASNHPKSQAILQYIEQQEDWNDGYGLKVHDWQEISGKGIHTSIGHHNIKVGAAHFMDNSIIDDQAQEGVYIQINGQIRGKFLIQQHIRDGLGELIDYFKKIGPIHLLSGDNERERSFFTPYFDDKNLHFRQSPQDKLEFIKGLQEEEKVLMLGDGLNDAGALQQSDIGIVITENTNNFTPASDAILAAQSFRKLPKMIDFTKRSIRLVYGAYAFALAYNFIGLSFAVQGALSPIVAAILMPLSSISIALYGTLSTQYLGWKTFREDS
ncbi:MAG: HAD-IC family P-type ATPase, partial [Bacteroidota bacterium]